MKSQKTFVLFQNLLANSNTIDYLWVLNAPQILPKSDEKHI